MISLLAGALALVTHTADFQAQRKGGGGLATFAVNVSDPSGTPLTGVLVNVEGPVTRQVRTERGRIALEDLPGGLYRFRFEKEGFITLEREVTARGGAPIDVKVTLTPAPKPPPPKIEPLPPPRPPAVKADPVAMDISAFIEKNFVGRAAGKSSPLACSGGGTATLIQLREPLEEHTHADADEYLYVIAGAGVAKIAGRDEPLKASVFMLIPRGVPHVLSAGGRSPLVLLSIRAGEPCTAK
jgi:hypothetical protein